MSPSKMLSRASSLQEPVQEETLTPVQEAPTPVVAPKPVVQPDPMVEPEEVKSLLASALKEEEPIPTVERTVVLSEDRSPRALWHWAFRKVAAKNMVKRIGFSFMNTMVDKEETVMSRLEKIEKKLFFLPNEMMTYTNTQTDKLGEKLTGEIARIDAALVAFDKQVCENFNDMGIKVADVTNNLATVTADLANLRLAVEELMSSSVDKMQGEIDELTKWRQHIYDHKLKSLIHQYDEQAKQFKDLHDQAATLTGQVGTSIKSNQRVYDADPAESLTTLLTIDTNMRNMREKLVRLETGLKSSTPALLSLKDDILCILGEDKGLEQIENIENMLTSDFDSVVSSMNQASTSLKQHDAILAERWRALSEMLKAVKEVANISSKLEIMESNIDGKIAQDEVEEVIKPHVDSAIVKALQPVEDKQTSSKEQMVALTERVTKVEISVDDAAMEGKPLNMQVPTNAVSNTEGIRNSSEMVGVSELLNGGGDIEGALGPMIKNLVEMYCMDWENGGGSQDLYDQSYDSQDMNDDDPFLEVNDFSEPDTSARCDDQVDGDNVGQKSPSPVEQVSSQPSQQPSKQPSKSVVSNQNLDGGSVQPSRESTPRGNQENINQPQQHHRQHHLKQHKQPLASSNSGTPRRDGTNSDVTSIVVGDKDDSASATEQGSTASRPSRVSGVNRASRQSRIGGAASVISREDSTVSMSSRDGRGRGRGRGREGGGVDPAELQNLRQDVARLHEKLTEMNQKKIDIDAVKLLMNQKADSKLLAKKVDTDVVTTIEDAVKGCLQNIGDLRQMQGNEIQELKADLGRKIKANLKAMFKSKEDEGKGTNASTKSICLTCGQDSPMKVHPSLHPHPSFLPALNSNSTVGPDVLRGGFKLPVSVPVKVSKYAEFLDPDMARELSHEMSIKAAGGLKKSNTLTPDTNMGDSGFDSLHSSSVGSRQPLVRPSSQSTASYVEDQSSIRPIFRKGFPAKKSHRPVSTYVMSCCR